MTWIALTLFISRFTSLCDCFLVMNPAATTFQHPPGPSGLHGHTADPDGKGDSDGESGSDSESDSDIDEDVDDRADNDMMDF
eukprot:CAMPEP_0180790786 /NCGR_PEP_ID=MMETSP1038_2-20121128/53441_1 /TAXON_ID=632150 /ORGANISM="Azadinium spinosum, Strain 3D9" /LENGTH=81 /DNA_ID=CAMNT_0022828841 /DNA_START=98 /DNA_END=343 /DNA_ORIENTATION=-